MGGLLRGYRKKVHGCPDSPGIRLGGKDGSILSEFLVFRPEEFVHNQHGHKPKPQSYEHQVEKRRIHKSVLPADRLLKDGSDYTSKKR